MADLNPEQQQFNELLRQANEQMIRTGRVLPETQQALTESLGKAKTATGGFTKSVEYGSQAIAGLAGAGIAAGKALYSGATGATAFNSSLDQLNNGVLAMGKTLAAFLPGGMLVKGMVAGVTMLASATIKQQQAAATFAEKLNTGYNKLSDSGAAA